MQTANVILGSAATDVITELAHIERCDTLSDSDVDKCLEGSDWPERFKRRKTDPLEVFGRHLSSDSESSPVKSLHLDQKPKLRSIKFEELPLPPHFSGDQMSSFKLGKERKKEWMPLSNLSDLPKNSPDRFGSLEGMMTDRGISCETVDTIGRDMSAENSCPGSSKRESDSEPSQQKYTLVGNLDRQHSDPVLQTTPPLDSDRKPVVPEARKMRSQVLCNRARIVKSTGVISGSSEPAEAAVSLSKGTRKRPRRLKHLVDSVHRPPHKRSSAQCVKSQHPRAANAGMLFVPVSLPRKSEFVPVFSSSNDATRKEASRRSSAKKHRATRTDSKQDAEPEESPACSDGEEWQPEWLKSWLPNRSDRGRLARQRLPVLMILNSLQEYSDVQSYEDLHKVLLSEDSCAQCEHSQNYEFSTPLRRSDARAQFRGFRSSLIGSTSNDLDLSPEHSKRDWNDRHLFWKPPWAKTSDKLSEDIFMATDLCGCSSDHGPDIPQAKQPKNKPSSWNIFQCRKQFLSPDEGDEERRKRIPNLEGQDFWCLDCDCWWCLKSKKRRKKESAFWDTPTENKLHFTPIKAPIKIHASEIPRLETENPRPAQRRGRNHSKSNGLNDVSTRLMKSNSTSEKISPVNLEQASSEDVRQTYGPESDPIEWTKMEKEQDNQPTTTTRTLDSPTGDGTKNNQNLEGDSLMNEKTEWVETTDEQVKSVRETFSTVSLYHKPMNSPVRSNVIESSQNPTLETSCERRSLKVQNFQKILKCSRRGGASNRGKRENASRRNGDVGEAAASGAFGRSKSESGLVKSSESKLLDRAQQNDASHPSDIPSQCSEFGTTPAKVQDRNSNNKRLLCFKDVSQISHSHSTAAYCAGDPCSAGTDTRTGDEDGSYSLSPMNGHCSPQTVSSGTLSAVSGQARLNNMCFQKGLDPTRNGDDLSEQRLGATVESIKASSGLHPYVWWLMTRRNELQDFGLPPKDVVKCSALEWELLQRDKMKLRNFYESIIEFLVQFPVPRNSDRSENKLFKQWAAKKIATPYVNTETVPFKQMMGTKS